MCRANARNKLLQHRYFLGLLLINDGSAPNPPRLRRVFEFVCEKHKQGGDELLHVRFAHLTLFLPRCWFLQGRRGHYSNRRPLSGFPCPPYRRSVSQGRSRACLPMIFSALPPSARGISFNRHPSRFSQSPLSFVRPARWAAFKVNVEKVSKRGFVALSTWAKAAIVPIVFVSHPTHPMPAL